MARIFIVGIKKWYEFVIYCEQSEGITENKKP